METRESITPLVAPFLQIPHLRAFWPMSSADNSANAYDLSGQGRTLTGANTPSFAVTGSPTIPYVTLNGTNQYMYRADEAGLDLGTVGAFTVGCWAYFTNAAGTQEAIITKGDGTAAGTDFWLTRATTGGIRFLVSTGAAIVEFTTTATIGAAAWRFVVGRFTTASELAVFINGAKETYTTGIPSSSVNSTTAFNIGTYNNGAGIMLPGRVSCAFASQAALADSVVSSIYQQTRGWFGV